MSSPMDILTRILRPAGGGIHVVSTGIDELRALQAAIYGAKAGKGPEPGPAQAQWIDELWRKALAQISEAEVAILGVPSDIGAGFTRGANRAPGAIRQYLLGRPEHPIWSDRVVDLGDVFTVPHFLSDEMLSEPQLAAAREALYGTDAMAERLPVSPLDICESVLRIVYAINPKIRPVVIGGDHSVAWPAFLAAHRHWEIEKGRRLGLLHFDAHTDLLSHRLGVRYCFATWAWHANELLQRDGRLVQVGIRASGRDKAHWEQSMNVRQYWAQEANSRGVEELIQEIGDHFEELGVDALYVSNDIDGTDPQWAASTGTPEPDGLSPDLVSQLTLGLGQRFPLVAGDVVEVAPPLANDLPGHPDRTLHTAGRYISDLII